MANTPDELKKLQSESLQAGNSAALKMLEGFEKLTALNLRMARESMEQSAEQINALLVAKDVKSLTDLVSSFAQPPTEKFTAYAKAVSAIAKEANSGFAEMVQQQIAKGNQQLAAAIEQMARSAPAGSEGAVAFMKQAMAGANSTYEQLNEATRKFVGAGALAADAAASGKAR